MEVEGRVKIKTRRISKVRAAIEQVLQNAERSMTTTEVRAGVAQELGENVTRQAISRHLNDLQADGRVAGEVQEPRGAKGWTWVRP